MTAATKLFNIRMTPDKHNRFKKFADEEGLSMGAILNGYIDALLKEESELVGIKSGRKTAVWEDPLADVRGQYQKGRDF